MFAASPCLANTSRAARAVLTAVFAASPCLENTSRAARIVLTGVRGRPPRRGPGAGDGEPPPMPWSAPEARSLLALLPFAVWIGGVVLVNQRARQAGYPALALSLVALFLGPPAAAWALWITRKPRPTEEDLRHLLQIAEASRLGVRVEDEDDFLGRRFPGLGRLWQRARASRREPDFWSAVVALVRFEQTSDRLLLWRPLDRLGRLAIAFLGGLTLVFLAVQIGDRVLGRPLSDLVPGSWLFVRDLLTLAGSPAGLWLVTGLAAYLLWLRWYDPRLLKMGSADRSTRTGRALHLLHCALAAGESPAELPPDLLTEVGFDPNAVVRSGDLEDEAAVMAALSATNPLFRPLVEVARANGRFEWLVEQMARQEHADLRSLISGMTLVMHMMLAALGLAGLALGWILVR